MRVAVVSEYYPRASDPVLGVWAHRQALAARAAGAEVRVLVLYRPVPPRAALSHGPRALARELAQLLRQPGQETRDGLAITYVPFLAPPRWRSYAGWGSWAAPPLALALRNLRRTFPFDLVHCHNAIPAGEAARRARIQVPLVVSVHGADVLSVAPHAKGGREAVARALGAARLVLTNSAGIEQLATRYGARHTRVVHLGAQPAGGVPEGHPGETPKGAPGRRPTLVTVAHLVSRKRHADVIRAVALLGDRHPGLRYVVVGDGPERGGLERLAVELGVSEQVAFTGQLEPRQALAALAGACLFVMPSVDEALGVAYLEAMGMGIPALGCRGEPGPQEISAAGEGMRLVPPRDPARLADELDALLSDGEALRLLGERARSTVERSFSWERCGAATVEAYRWALGARESVSGP